MNKISVIMSAFNCENTVEKSINSILSQTYENFEFLISDDDSSDNTSEIIKKMQKNDSRIIFYPNNKNIGLTKSLNKLLSLSSGNFIARQDADDLSLENRFDLQLAFIEKYNLDGCTTLATSLQSNKVIHKYKNLLPPKLVIKFKNPFIHGSLILKNEILKSIGGYDERFLYAQDYKLMNDILKKKYKVKIMKKKLYILNTRNNISSNFRNEQEYFANCVRKDLNP